MHIYIVWPETWNEESRIVWQTKEWYNEVTYEFRKNLREPDISGDVLRLNVFMESKEIEWTSMFHFFSPCHTTISSWLQTFLTFLNHEIFAKHTTHKWNAKYTMTTVHTNSRKRLRTNVMWRIICCSTSTIPPLWFLYFSVLSFVSACLGDFIGR